MLKRSNAPRRLWRNEDPGLEMQPRPFRPGGPPIWVGGTGPRMLRSQAESFDGWLPLSPTPATTRQVCRAVREAASGGVGIPDSNRDRRLPHGGLLLTMRARRPARPTLIRRLLRQCRLRSMAKTMALMRGTWNRQRMVRRPIAPRAPITWWLSGSSGLSDYKRNVSNSSSGPLQQPTIRRDDRVQVRVGSTRTERLKLCRRTVAPLKCRVPNLRARSLMCSKTTASALASRSGSAWSLRHPTAMTRIGQNFSSASLKTSIAMSFLKSAIDVSRGGRASRPC